MKRMLAALTLGLAALSASADIIVYEAALAPEAPGATGSGSVTVTFDDVANTLQINADWAGLSGTTTVAHIHCCTPTPGSGTVGVAVTPGTLPGFPVGLAAGSYVSPLIDLDDPASFTAAFVTTFAGGSAADADAALIAGIDAGVAYFNVHSTTFPGGEIRGFLAPALSVPEPATSALLAASLAAFAAGAGRRRRPA